jgi:DNA polymerase III subunit delta'
MAFADIIGQDTAISVLRRALQHQRIPHAYLFAGYDGVGKKYTAITLAKALNCKQLTADACDHCSSCHKIETGNHPDVRVIEPDGQTIKIEQIRALQHDVGYKPYEGRRKVYIIDSAEALGVEAANALLKTLEEPSADSILILVTTNQYALLPTVISRCQLIRFITLGVEPLTTLLVQKKRILPEQARLIASLSEGCPGRALAMDMADTLKKRAVVEEVLNTLSSGLQDVRIVFAKVELLLEEKAAIQEFLDIMLAWYRDVYILGERGNPALIANADVIDRLAHTATMLSVRQLRRLFDIVYQAKLDIAHNANLQLALEVMLMSLIEVYNDRIRWR